MSSPNDIPIPMPFCEFDNVDILAGFLACIFAAIIVRNWLVYSDRCKQRESAEALAAATPEQREELFRKLCELDGLEVKYGTDARLVVKKKRWIPTLDDIVEVRESWLESAFRTETDGEDEEEESWEPSLEKERYRAVEEV